MAGFQSPVHGLEHEERKRSLYMTDQEIFGKVRECLIDALGVEDDEVNPEATLVGDLGAESIDFLDIIFRLEKMFDIKIPRGDLFPEDILSGEGNIEDGKLTEKGLAQVREKLSFLDISRLEKNPRVSQISNLFTVKMIADYMKSKVG